MSYTREDLDAGRIGLDDLTDGSVPRIGPVHPGSILREEFLDPLGIGPYRLAKDLHVPVNRISEILDGRRAISADTALRLGRYFGMTAEFWSNLQANYELDLARTASGARIAAEVDPRAA